MDEWLTSARSYQYSAPLILPACIDLGKASNLDFDPYQIQHLYTDIVKVLCGPALP